MYFQNDLTERTIFFNFNKVLKKKFLPLNPYKESISDPPKTIILILYSEKKDEEILKSDGK